MWLSSLSACLAVQSSEFSPSVLQKLPRGVHACHVIPALCWQTQEDLKFKVILSYKASLGLA